MPSHIKSVRYFGCGYCVNNLGIVFKGHKREKRKFPAGTYLIKHDKHGLILFDTGYDANICKTGFIGRAYNIANPTKVTADDKLKAQLARNNIKATDIKTIILSHLHPDHIGGLKDFPKAKFILSEKAMKSYKNRKLRQLIMPDFFPADFEKRAEIITNETMNKPILDDVCGYDYFGDGSLILIELNGHANGQLCALINNKILLAADSCWGNDLLDISKNMKFPATMIQDNMNNYRETLDVLKQFKKKGIKLMFSHDTYNKEELL